MTDDNREPFMLEPPFRGDGESYAEKVTRQAVDRADEQSAVNAAGDAPTLREAAEHLDRACALALRHG